MAEPHSPHDGAQLAQAQTYGEALRLATAWLRTVEGATSPVLDAQLLLAHATATTRPAVIAYPERALATGQAAEFAGLVRRRASGEPVAYLTGHRAFMGLDLLVDARALIPRPETELLVEAALTEVRQRLERGESPLVADIGTGSGAIALAVAAGEPRLPRVLATDISADALALAAENASRLGLSERLGLLQGDLLEPLDEPVDLLLANLPYVAPRAAPSLPTDVRLFEPALALYGADDGLGHLRRLFAQAPDHLRPRATLYLEFGYDQRQAVEALARATFPHAEIEARSDYAGWDRFLIVRTA